MVAAKRGRKLGMRLPDSARGKLERLEPGESEFFSVPAGMTVTRKMGEIGSYISRIETGATYSQQKWVAVNPKTLAVLEFVQVTRDT